LSLRGGDAEDWEGWEQIGPAGTLASAPAVVKGGGLYLFGRGPDDRIQMLSSIQMLSRGEFEGWT
jgi:hypothetical protein